MTNQNLKQIVRDNIDKQFLASEWIIQNKKRFNLATGLDSFRAIIEGLK
jgi:type I restriction enzyme, R subunit